MSPRNAGAVRLAWIATAVLVLGVGTWTISTGSVARIEAQEGGETPQLLAAIA